MPQTKKQAWTTWEDMPIDEFRTRAEIAQKKVDTLVADIHELFPGLVTLTREQRKVSPRLRERAPEMYLKILDATDKKPALFESLADADDGMDPQTFESRLLRDRVEKYALLGDIDAALARVEGALGDTGHYLAGRFQDAVLSAYRIGKAHARTDKVINDILAPVIDWMRESAVAAAATRAKKSEKHE